MTEDAGKLLLRLTLGILMLFYGYAKLTKGVSGIETSLISAGLPGWTRCRGAWKGPLVLSMARNQQR